MIPIGEIAELRAWKEDQVGLGSLDIHQVSKVAMKIQ